ncbi:MAG: hypothetical protein EA401_09855 [Planctomycetota bacterium]|nr:MAG: hypothetical protein EA401_09855 [Planctomycetota bacterium]
MNHANPGSAIDLRLFSAGTIVYQGIWSWLILAASAIILPAIAIRMASSYLHPSLIFAGRLQSSPNVISPEQSDQRMEDEPLEPAEIHEQDKVKRAAPKVGVHLFRLSQYIDSRRQLGAPSVTAIDQTDASGPSAADDFLFQFEELLRMRRWTERALLLCACLYAISWIGQGFTH